MNKFLVVLLALAVICFIPMIASADLVGDCYDCHTMHNSEQNQPVFAGGPQPSLLNTDCLGCHAQAPGGGQKNITMSGGSVIPQVAHSATEDLAGGNFNQSSDRMVHSVVDMWGNGVSPPPALGDTFNDQPPGIAHSSNRNVFTTELATNAFDAFTCAGARGCHGTRSQSLVAGTVDNGTANVWEVQQMRTGIAALTGAHHNNIDGEGKITSGYGDTAVPHDGQMVADGYRFIVGVQGYENYAREYVNENDHNEYYGSDQGMGGGCSACHVQDTISGGSSRMAFNSNIKVPNNSMSGFCATCHSNFHSTGTGADYRDNGSSAAWLRHPSDYVIPDSGEYALYTEYDPTAPVMRSTVVDSASSTVTPGSDMVGCLSCHVAHGSAYDYMLRFDYTEMTAGAYGDVPTAQAVGGCLACHTQKGVLPQNR